MMAHTIAAAEPRLSSTDRQRDLTPLLLILAPAVLLLHRFWLFAKVPWILPIAGLTLLAAHHRGLVRWERDRLLAFLGFGCLALLTTLAHGWMGDMFSPRSVALLLATYSLFVVGPAAPCDRPRLIGLWQRLSLLCALLGIFQIAFFSATGQVLDVSMVLPPAVADNPGYNTLEIDRVTGLIRANGIVFLEASFFSQFMALALVIEACFSRNPYRLAAFGLALLCAMSGTGILMLGVALAAAVFVYPAAFLQRRTVISLGAGVVAAASVIVLVPGLYAYFAERTVTMLDFGHTDTSSYIRFVAPWVAVYRLCESGLVPTLTGLGPGLSFSVARLQLDTLVNLTPLPQLIIYYGVVTALAFVVFLAAFTVRRYTKAQWVVVLTLLFQYLFCSGSLLAPYITCVLLWFTLVFHPSPQGCSS
jgi:hypothetical protein